MASSKRGPPFDHYGSSNQHFNKKHKPTRPLYNSASYDGHEGGGFGKAQQRSNNASRQRDTALSAVDTSTGLVALLDRFVADETTPQGDREILHHARELRRLLCSRGGAKSNGVKHELDEKRPDNVAKVAIPEYIERKVREAADLPPLPPIAEPHLHEAVFTHRSAHVNPVVSRHVQDFDLSIDYERLELLGDAYIELIASRALYNRFPHVDVPELCSWRERLVENSNLAKFSRAYDFPARLKHNLTDQGGKTWEKVVADMLEAYVAALVLSDPENGFNIAEEWLTVLWGPQLLNFKEKIIENPQARNQLNKLVLTSGVKLQCREDRPMTYDSNSIQRYFIGIYLTGWGYDDEWLGGGEGQNKVQAGIAAAAAALKRQSPVLQDAVQKKAELMEARHAEANAKAAAEEATMSGSALVKGDKHEGEKSNRTTEEDRGEGTPSKKKKGDADTASPEKKKKKHKKDKKEKKHKASTDDDSD